MEHPKPTPIPLPLPLPGIHSTTSLKTLIKPTKSNECRDSAYIKCHQRNRSLDITSLIRETLNENILRDPKLQSDFELASDIAKFFPVTPNSEAQTQHTRNRSLDFIPPSYDYGNSNFTMSGHSRNQSSSTASTSSSPRIRERDCSIDSTYSLSLFSNMYSNNLRYCRHHNTNNHQSPDTVGMVVKCPFCPYPGIGNCSDDSGLYSSSGASGTTGSEYGECVTEGLSPRLSFDSSSINEDFHQNDLSHIDELDGTAGMDHVSENEDEDVTDGEQTLVSSLVSNNGELADLDVVDHGNPIEESVFLAEEVQEDPKPAHNSSKSVESSSPISVFSRIRGSGSKALSFSSSPTSKPLTVGNTVTTGMRNVLKLNIMSKSKDKSKGDSKENTPSKPVTPGCHTGIGIWTTLARAASNKITNSSNSNNSQSAEHSKDSEGGDQNSHLCNEGNENNSAALVENLCNNETKTESKSLLLRFFDSKIFNMSYALSYLLSSKESGVQQFIGNRMFEFSEKEVDFYLPQLITLFIQVPDLQDILRPYLLARGKRSAHFSLQCVWLLDAYSHDGTSTLNSRCNSSSLKLKKLLLSNSRLRNKKSPRKHSLLHPGFSNGPIPHVTTARQSNSDTSVPTPNSSKSFKTHQRSVSDASVIRPGHSDPNLNNLKTMTARVGSIGLPRNCLGDLASGHGFDNGCMCFQFSELKPRQEECTCGSPQLQPQLEFVRALIRIGKNLSEIPLKDDKTSKLISELSLVNLNLPARVWIPVQDHISHLVLRIPPQDATVLNSKDKTPYMIYVEVLEVDDVQTAIIPAKKNINLLRHSRSTENILEGLCNSNENRNGSIASASKDNNLNTNINTNSISPPSLSFSNIPTSNSSCFDLDCWSQEDDEISQQYLQLKQNKQVGVDSISQMSMESCDSRGPVYTTPLEIRRRLCESLSVQSSTFQRDPEDPSASILKEPYEIKQRRIRNNSPFGDLPGWKLLPCIVKCGDDLRQELMANQLLALLKDIWYEEHVDLWVRPCRITALSNDSGMIEPIVNTVSLHQIKKHSTCLELLEYFRKEFGPDNSEEFLTAQRNFVKSLAGYCLTCYLFQIKDRHNGNILLDNEGHLIHIDFGYMLSSSPKSMGFESSPFKLIDDFVQVMGGMDSDMFKYFKILMLQGLVAVRKYQERILTVVDVMRLGSQLSCLNSGGARAVSTLKYRFHMSKTEEQLEKLINDLVSQALNSITTTMYDQYQYITNGIM